MSLVLLSLGMSVGEVGEPWKVASSGFALSLLNRKPRISFAMTILERRLPARTTFDATRRIVCSITK